MLQSKRKVAKELLKERRLNRWFHQTGTGVAMAILLTGCIEAPSDAADAGSKTQIKIGGSAEPLKFLKIWPQLTKPNPM